MLGSSNNLAQSPVSAPTSSPVRLDMVEAE
jgi:hypothetical protein